MMLVLMVASCTSLNCPLNNTTYTKYKLMGNVKTLNATLTISTTKQEGEDSVLINKDENVDSFILPMSYHQPEDVFFLKFRMQTIRYGKIQYPSRKRTIHISSL